MSTLDLVKKAYNNPKLTRPDWTKDVSRSESPLWLNKNENIDPELNLFILGLLDKVKNYAINTYPETAKVYHKLAQLENLNPKNFLLTCGSDGSIRTMFDVFIEPNDKVLRTNPTFAMYEVYSKIYGAQELIVDYESSSNGPVLDFDKFISVIENERPKLVCLPNPDSPSGTVLSDFHFNQLIAVTKKIGAVLLIDEAYYPFYEFTAASLVKEHEHLFVCRSFSKAWGAAGFRVGYIIGHEKLMDLLHKNRPMYEVSTFSTEVINLLLDNKNEIEKSVQRLKAGAFYFKQEIEKMGYQVVLTHGNFLHVNFKGDDKKIAEILKSTVLYRSDFNNAVALSGFSRFSLGTKDQFIKIINELKRNL